MAFCAKCGTEGIPGGKFCGECGTPFPSGPSKAELTPIKPKIQAPIRVGTKKNSANRAQRHSELRLTGSEKFALFATVVVGTAVFAWAWANFGWGWAWPIGLAFLFALLKQIGQASPTGPVVTRTYKSVKHFEREAPNMVAKGYWPQGQMQPGRGALNQGARSMAGMAVGSLFGPVGLLTGLAASFAGKRKVTVIWERRTTDAGAAD